MFQKESNKDRLQYKPPNLSIYGTLSDQNKIQMLSHSKILLKYFPSTWSSRYLKSFWL